MDSEISNLIEQRGAKVSAKATLKPESQSRTKTVIERLHDWGRWARHCPSKTLMYPTIEPYRKLYSLPGDTLGGYAPIEIECEIIDKALAALTNLQGEKGGFTAFYFYTGMSFYQIEELTNVSRYRLEKLVGGGIDWVEGYLYDPEEHF